MLKVQRQVYRVPSASADAMGVHRAQKRGNRKNKEIDTARRTAFHIVGVDFLDDAVRNHRGARCDPEYEHSNLR